MSQWNQQQYQPPQAPYYNNPGQLQPYGQMPPQGQYPQAAYPQQPVVVPKSTGTGLILGLLVPGVGCMYAGQIAAGVAIMVIWLISIPLVFIGGIGFVTGFIAWIMSAIFGYTMTRDWNARRGFVS